jgi:hypothetical protein
MSEVINLNDTSPVAPAGEQNVKWQKGPQSGTDPTTGLPIFPVSAYFPASAYDIAFYCPDVFGASEVCLELNVVRAFTLPASLTGSIAKLDVAATATTTFTITRNGSSIGSIAFAAGSQSGTFTFTTAVTFAAADVIEVVAPASPDVTAAGLSVTLCGSRS